MSSEIPTPSIKDRVAMFQKLTSKSGTTSSVNTTAPKIQPIPQQKPPSNTNITPQKHVETVPLVKNVSGNGGGQVESPSIVKPSKAKQTQSYNLQNNYTYVSNPMTTSLASKPVTPPPPPLATKHSENVVKVNQNGSVDKEKLLSQNDAKKMFEGQNLPIQTGYPAWVKAPTVIKKQVDDGPKEVPVVQTNVHIASVKDNANKLNQYFVNRASQKAVEEEQARRHKQQHPPVVSEHVQQPKNESNAPEVVIGNTQNIVGGAFSESQAEVGGGNNALNVPNQNFAQSQESKDAESEDNSLVARLKKRKQMKKASFDSDED